jgi:hypothetical protein
MDYKFRGVIENQKGYMETVNLCLTCLQAMWQDQGRIYALGRQVGESLG